MTSTPKSTAIRVMIVDDSAFMRKAVERILLSAGDIEVCDSLSSGELAVEKVEASRPDLITMDVEMPGMGGLEAVKAIMTRRRTPIIMLSSLTDRGTETTIRALENGAADFIAKPAGGAMEIGRITAELLDKVHALARRSSTTLERPFPSTTMRQSLGPIETNAVKADRSSITSAPASITLVATKRRSIECLAIGISTGGPAALSQVCSHLSAQVNLPIIVVQHMPAGFTKPLADRLNAQCPIEVVEAQNDMPMQAGRMVIGVAGKQMRLKRQGGRVFVQIAESQGESLYMPSADVLFKSIAEVYGKSAVAFIMTGMGNDGTEGLKDLKKVGGYVYGQDEASSVVYGMPRAAALAGLVDTVLPLSSIAEAIILAAKGNVV